MKLARHTDELGWEVREVAEASIAAAAQVAIFEAQGFRRVTEAERPQDTPWEIYSAGYREDGNGGIEEFYWGAPRIIPLNRDKLLVAVEAAGMLEQAIALFGSDEAAQDWWTNSMNYVEGSAMAEAFKAAFSLSDDQMHALVEASRA